VPPTQRIADHTAESLLAATRDVHPSPGSGTAGAVALALAASCAAKAANISLKHNARNEALHTGARTFESIAADALTAGDEDAAAFEQYIADGAAAGSAPLESASAHFESLIDRLEQTIQSVERHIDRVMAGDLVAARALARAARLIQVRNESELER
jgi:hypothetical protein